MNKDHWDLTFKQRIWLEWLKVHNITIINKMGMKDMVDYVLMKGHYNKDQRKKLNQLHDETKQS